MTTYNLVEGWTDPIDCIIEADGSALVLTGFSVALVAYDKNGTALTVAGTASITDAALGKVRYAPTAGDVLLLSANSPLKIRWKLTDGAGEIRYVPNADADKWIVRKP